MNLGTSDGVYRPRSRSVGTRLIQNQPLIFFDCFILISIMDNSMDVVGQAPVENSVSEENVDRCPICLESMEPFVLETSVRCSTCNAPYCSICLNRWLYTRNTTGQNYRAEECCVCKQLFPIVRLTLQTRHIVRVFTNLEDGLFKEMFQSFKNSLKGMAQRMESCQTVDGRSEVISDCRSYFQDSMSTRLTQIFNERYVQSVLPGMRSSEQVTTCARKHLEKMCSTVLVQTIRSKPKALLKFENAFRKKRIDAMIKPLGLQLRQKFLASRAYTNFVKAQAKKMKDCFEDVGKRPQTKAAIDMEHGFVALLSKFTRCEERKKISRELHDHVHARPVDDEFIKDKLELYVFFFNYDQDREDNGIMWPRFKNDVGDLVLALRLDERM